MARPRQFDEKRVLRAVRDQFWDAGYAATSLEDLMRVSGLGKGSLYAAFGDKRALYLKTLEGDLASKRALMEAALSSGRPLRVVLREIYHAMLDHFLSGDRGPRGCYLVGTAATEAVENPDVREVLASSVRDLDEGFRAAFSAARARGELGAQADPRALALLATSIVHTLALRARAGQPRALLQQVADSAVELLCPGGRPARKPRRRR